MKISAPQEYLLLCMVHVCMFMCFSMQERPTKCKFTLICDRLYISQPFIAFSRITFLYCPLVQFILIVIVLFFYSSYTSKITSTQTRSFRIIRFREKRDLTYALHSHNVYNSDGILDHSWRNYTELTLRTAAQGSQHTVDYTYD